MNTNTKRITSLSLIALAATLGVSASTSWNIQGQKYDVDTLYHAQIGPGITLTQLKLDGQYPQRVFYSSIDLTNPYNDMRARTAEEGVYAGTQTLSKVAQNTDREGGVNIAGVNGDFFGPNAFGSIVSNGTLHYLSNANTSHYWYMTDQDEMGVGVPVFSATCKYSSYNMPLGINTGRSNVYPMVLHTPDYGTTYKANGMGYYIIAELTEGKIGYTGTAKLKVTQIAKSENSTTSFNLPAGKVAISAMSASSYPSGQKASYLVDFLKTLKVGNILTITCANNTGLAGDIEELIGGYPVLVKDGAQAAFDVISGKEHLTNEMAPRTGIGYSADGKTAYIAVLDGRQTISTGFYAKQWADVLINIGCHNAVNLDGGGSSELYTKAFGMCNLPNGTKTERSVANSVWAISTAPADNEIASIAFEQSGTLSLPQFMQYTPRVYAYNQYGDLINTNLEDYTLSCPEELGICDGKTLTITGTGTYALTATYGNATTTMAIKAGSSDITPSMLYSSVLLDGYREWAAPIVAEINGEQLTLAGSSFNWSSSNEGVVTVDASGILKGVANGTATVTAVSNSFSGSIEVTVEISDKQYAPVDLTTSTWSLTSGGMTSASAANDAAGLKINYKVKTAGQAYTNLVCSAAKFYSLPDAFRITTDAPAGTFSKILLSLKDKNNAVKSLSVPITDGTADSFTFNVKDVFGSDDPTIYPIRIQMIRFDYTGAAGTEASFDITGVEAVYNNYEAGIDNVSVDRTEIGVYPNPARDYAYLAGVAEGTPYEIYALSGLKVAEGIAPEINCSALATGIYLVRTDKASTRLIVK